MKRSMCFDNGENPKKKQLKNTAKKYDVTWRYLGESLKGISPLMYLDGPSVVSSRKVVAFDLDGTLITTKRGKGFPLDSNDWKFLSTKVVPKLKSLFEDGFKLVVISNQAGIEKKKTKTSDIQKKLLDIMSIVGVPFQAFISTGENVYRKPCTGMWDLMVEKYNGGVLIDLVDCVYVGDAAGRLKGWALGRNKDFSCSDRKFAANIGIKFATPEEFFDGAVPCKKFEWNSIDPLTVLKTNFKDNDYANIASKVMEMVIFVGTPASGKSSFAKRYLKSYISVNRDSLKTVEKCVKIARDALSKKNSVVVDNTNPSKDARQVFIVIAKELNIPVRCFHFQTSLELAHHLNMFRQAQSLGKMRRVPDVGFNIYKSRFQLPELSEGFNEIVKIEFAPMFDSAADEILFKKWT